MRDSDSLDPGSIPGRTSLYLFVPPFFCPFVFHFFSFSIPHFLQNMINNFRLRLNLPLLDLGPTLVGVRYFLSFALYVSEVVSHSLFKAKAELRDDFNG